ncbi:MAG: hypothetical protein ACWA40_05135 [Planktomarina sp.]
MKLSQEFDGTFAHVIASPAALDFGDDTQRQMLFDAIREQSARDGCQGIILRGVHGGVSSDCVYVETGDTAAQAPTLQELCHLVENSPVPVVFLLSGPIWPGLFDLALAGHCRLADPSMHIEVSGWDELQIPAVGTVQRLAHMFGAQKAVDMVKGVRLGPLRSAKLGLIAGVAKGNLINAARGYLAGQIEKGQALVPPLSMQTGIEDAVQFQKEIADLSVGITDPFETRLIQAAEVAHMFPVDQALAFETASFAEFAAFDGYQGCAHVASLRRQKTPKRTAHGAVPHVALVHGSDMTMAYAELMVLHGVNTQIFVPNTGDQTFLPAWKAKLEALHVEGAIDGARRAAAEGWVITEPSAITAQVIIDTFDYGGVNAPDFSPDYMQPDAIYVLTTKWVSHPSVADIALEGQAFGTLILSHNTKLLEWSPAPGVTEDAQRPIMALAAVLGRSVVAAQRVVGGSSRWMEHALIHALEEALEHGGSLDVLDDIFVQKGWTKGPYQYFDHKDLADIVLRQKSYLRTLPQGTVYPNVLERYISFAQRNGLEKPRLYAQTAAGYMGNPMLQSMLGQVPGVDHMALYEGIIARVCHQACRLIGHGVIADAASADLISVDALGFPPHIGGIMKAAQDIGVSKLLDMQMQKVELDPSLTPTQVMINAAGAGGFYV